MEAQFAELAHNPDIIVATPGNALLLFWSFLVEGGGMLQLRLWILSAMKSQYSRYISV
jgi:hypothetical protein